ncbi:MAG: EscU/YscU/HrcU family type III secretion system export apparatus switch protein [Nitrospinae bacterium]|nr:EscU/YscU/HrcU family type III secretion system export apparatus switch protein [Nitrospinota bacterium]
MKKGDAKHRKHAVAVKYKPGEQAAPTVVAKGGGEVAEKIIAIAKEHGIPIKEDKDLVEVLSRLDLNSEVPPELYHVIAEVLAWVYRVNGKRAPATQFKTL